MIKDKHFVKFKSGTFGIGNYLDVQRGKFATMEVFHQGRTVEDQHVKYEATITVLVISKSEFMVVGQVASVEGEAKVEVGDTVHASIKNIFDVRDALTADSTS